MNPSQIICVRCGYTHPAAQHKFTESGSRSPVCMHCDGGPATYIPGSDLVPLIQAPKSGFTFSPSGALRAARDGMGRLFKHGRGAE